VTARALVIAIEDYPQADGLARTLEGTNDAADAFIEWLIQTRKLPLEHIRYCGAPGRRRGRTRGTTREEILEEVQLLVRQGQDATQELFVFFSGHGFAYAESPERKATDILVTSEFTRPEDSGGACIQLREFQEKLQLALGPGDHYYFIDACRNVISEEQVEPLRLGKRFGKSSLGLGTLFTLYSTAPQSVARTDSGFSQHLLQGLHGRGRAKGWVEDRMYVTFPLLHRYVRSKMLRQEADLRIEGSSEGHILEVRPIPRSKCLIRILNASEQDSFYIQCTDRRGLKFITEEMRFQGQEAELELPPGDYEVDVRHPSMEVNRVLSPKAKHRVDAYEEACTVEFVKQPLGTRRHMGHPMGYPGDPLPRALGSLELVDGRVPREHRTPTLALTLLGAGRIVYPEDLSPPARRLQLHDFSGIGPGESLIYVLAWFTRAVPGICIATGSSRQVAWREMKPVPGVDGLWEGVIPATSGPSIFSVLAAPAREGQRPSPLSYVTHLLPNRATLITLTEQEGVELELHQYFLPIHSLFHELSSDLLRRIEGTISPSFTHALWEVQHAFARKQRLETSLSQNSRDYMMNTLRGSNFDPVMALVGAYEILRHERVREFGAPKSPASFELPEALLGRFFAGIPDIDLLAKMTGNAFRTGGDPRLVELVGSSHYEPRSPPLILDGLLAWDFEEAELPLSASRLTYEGPWVSWRGAVDTAGTPASDPPHR
jgi:hypothetical protein